VVPRRASPPDPATPARARLPRAVDGIDDLELSRHLRALLEQLRVPQLPRDLHRLEDVEILESVEIVTGEPGGPPSAGEASAGDGR